MFGAKVPRHPTLLEADGVSNVGLAGATRTKGFAVEGTSPHPPRSLSMSLGCQRSSGDHLLFAETHQGDFWV